jgi:hypothetical protein
VGKIERGKGARAWVERKERAHCRLRLPATHTAVEQLPSSGGAYEREEEGGNLWWRGRKKGGDAWIWQTEVAYGRKSRRQ